MQSIKKNVSFIKHTAKMVFSNIPRLVLSICGLFIGLFILTVGMLMLNSYYDECMSKARQFSDNTILVKIGGNESEINRMIGKSGVDVVSKKTISDDEKTIYIQKYTNEQYCILKTRLVGTTDMSDGKILSKYNDYTYIPYDAQIKKGRFINAGDVAGEKKVTVIDEFTANLLFGEENPIGKKIVMDVQADGVVNIEEKPSDEVDEIKEFEIVGVYTCNQATVDNELKLKKFKSAGRETLSLDTVIYIPESVYSKMYDEKENYIILNCDKNEEYEKLSVFLADYKAIYSSEFYTFDVITKTDIVNSLKNELKPMKMFMWLILIILFIISGISSMNTMFFSVKERMGEIGIKKSLGAGKKEIIFQFILEGVFMSLCAGIIAVVLGVFLGRYIGNIIQNVMYISFSVHYSLETILVPLGVAGIYGIVFSFVPSFYGANIKVTDALRFE